MGEKGAGSSRGRGTLFWRCIEVMDAQFEGVECARWKGEKPCLLLRKMEAEDGCRMWDGKKKRKNKRFARYSQTKKI